MEDTTEKARTVRDSLSIEHKAGAEFFRIEPWRTERRPIESGDSIPYGWLESCAEPEAEYVGHRYLVGSDYSGGALIRANLKAWDETAGDCEASHEIHGGYNTAGRVLRLSAPESPEALALLEIIAGLEDYPAVSDDSLSEQEHAEECEAWESYGRGDFARALSSAFGVEIDAPEGEPADVDSLFAVFAAMAERGNVNGGPGIIHEETGPCFLFDDVASAAVECGALPMLFAAGMVRDVEDIDPEDDADIIAAEALGRRLRAIAECRPASVDLFRFLFEHVEREGDRITVRRYRYPDGWRYLNIDATPPLFPVDGVETVSPAPEVLRPALADLFGCKGVA